MGFEANVVQALKELRASEGVTPARLEAHPLLMQLLQAESGADGVQRLTELCDKVEGDEQRLALKNALAIGYPALSGPEERRKARTTHPSGGVADLPFSTRTHRRREDEGMVLLAGLLLAMPGADVPELDEDDDSTYSVTVRVPVGWEVRDDGGAFVPGPDYVRQKRQQKKERTFTRRNMTEQAFLWATIGAVIGMVVLGFLLWRFGAPAGIPRRH